MSVKHQISSKMLQEILNSIESMDLFFIKILQTALCKKNTEVKK